MKLIIFLALLFTVACGANSNKTAEPAVEDLHADILLRPAPNQPIIEITFYRNMAVNGQTNGGSGKNVIAVDAPSFNGVAMISAVNLSGQPIYKTDAVNLKPGNVVTASVGGHQFQASVMLELRLVNKMTTVTFSEVAKFGS